MLIDSATIEVLSGKGGDGCVSLRREKYVPKGGPDGGDGGKGGSVILVATDAVDTLLDFAGHHHWRARSGEPGRGKSQHGKDADDLTVPVPPGTQVYDAETGEFLADLDSAGRQWVAAAGGKGGFGNEHFKSPTNQTPREATPGEPAVQRQLRLELKLLADIGLIGKPNAGKSTLLARVSRATPKIADYPFTTLEPQLGIAELAGDDQGGGASGGGASGGGGRRLVIADIPGLIEQAHEGRGLGTRFLRHIERTSVLLHVLEVEPADGSDPVENYRAIRSELAAYTPELAAKPEVLAMSKMDLLASDEDRATAVSLLEQALGCTVLPISAATGQGIPELLEHCWPLARRRPSTEPWPKASSLHAPQPPRDSVSDTEDPA